MTFLVAMPMMMQTPHGAARGRAIRRRIVSEEPVTLVDNPLPLTQQLHSAKGLAALVAKKIHIYSLTEAYRMLLLLLHSCTLIVTIMSVRALCKCW